MVTRHVAQGLSLRRRGRARGAGREGATVAKPTRRRARLNAGSARTAAIDNALQYDSKLPLRSWSDVARRRLSRALCAHALRCPRRSRPPLRPRVCGFTDQADRPLSRPLRPYVCGIPDEVDPPLSRGCAGVFAGSRAKPTVLSRPLRPCVCGFTDEVDPPLSRPLRPIVRLQLHRRRLGRATATKRRRKERKERKERKGRRDAARGSDHPSMSRVISARTAKCVADAFARRVGLKPTHSLARKMQRAATSSSLGTIVR